LIDKIRQHCQSDPKLADYIFSTVHKSKGLEWQSVILVSVLHKNFFSFEEDESVRAFTLGKPFQPGLNVDITAVINECSEYFPKQAFPSLIFVGRARSLP
jgi:hypothetical protein